MSAAVLARVVRGGMVESVHSGHVVAVGRDGSHDFAAGDPGAVIFARSSLKPLQAVAMLRSGLDLADDLVALACASHNGEPRHLDGVIRILGPAGLQVAELQNTPDLPIGEAAQIAWLRAGRERESLAQNCSGKHAAMLATCVTAGWPTVDYLEPTHPLQLRIRETIRELTGDEPSVQTVDGCGAPLFSCTLAGLARAFGRIASSTDPSPAWVARAMNRHPEMVGGDGRDVTRLMAALPGVVAKDGAEGVYAVGLSDGRGAALKVLDGSQRPRPVVMAALLARLGIEHPVLAEIGRAPVLGHGKQVGQVEVAVEGLESPGTGPTVDAGSGVAS